MKLEIRPVRQYRTPKYPMQERVRDNPELLRTMPHRWQQHAAMYTALAMTASIGLTACSGVKEETTMTKETTATTTTTTTTTAAEVQATPKLRIPVFAHGDGRIGYGCVMVVPPIILNEEDAREIIVDEAGKRGVNFKNYFEEDEVEGLGYIDGAFPATNLRTGKMDGTWEGTFAFDGFDEERKLNFEYISEQDMFSFATDNGRIEHELDYKTMAEELSKVVENTAVFYDPGVIPEHSYSKELKESGVTRDEYNDDYEKRGLEMAEELLRQQVRDFLDFLAAEGVI